MQFAPDLPPRQPPPDRPSWPWRLAIVGAVLGFFVGYSIACGGL